MRRGPSLPAAACTLSPEGDEEGDDEEGDDEEGAVSPSRCLHPKARRRPGRGAGRGRGAAAGRQNIHAGPGKAGWAGERRRRPAGKDRESRAERAAAGPAAQRGCPAGSAARARPAHRGSCTATRRREPAPIPSHGQRENPIGYQQRLKTCRGLRGGLGILSAPL